MVVLGQVKIENSSLPVAVRVSKTHVLKLPSIYPTRARGIIVKAGVNMKAVFWLVITALTQISRLRFKQSRISMLIPEIYVLGHFVNFFGDF